MSTRLKQTYADWLFGGVMFLLCTGLTVLQYRWTGEVAHAEMIRLRGNLDEQSRALTRAFDAELSGSCDQLAPGGEDFGNQTREAAQLARFKSWKATNPRPIFSRIAMAVAAQNQIQLSLLDQKSGQFVRTNWPPEWSALQENLTDKITGGSPPFNDRRGVLLEFPVHRSPSDSGDEHWLIVELDLAYARNVWLPELVAKYLNPDGHAVNGARVRTGGDNSGLLYSMGTNSAVGDGTSSVSARFNTQGRTEENSRGPVRGGSWLLEAWHRPGVLEAVVSASRHRNLAVAGVLNVLMMATGIALLRHTHRARQLAEAQMNFVANVSHELRTPLTVIRGAAHNLKRGVVHERSQIEQYAGLIIQHAEQLGEMVEQVLQLAGAKKNPSAALRQPVAPAAVLNEAIAATAHDTQAAHCKVHLELPPSLPIVTGDAAALRRVFQNLIINAANHGGAGGWIGVTAVSDEDGGKPTVEIQVADRGPGIPQAELSEIFKPFFRGAVAQASQIRGSGLGLSLAREIIEAHGGSISVRSGNGSGTVFTVRLPVASTDQAK